MANTTQLWKRMMEAAKQAAMRHHWREAARIRRAWTDWYYRRLHRTRPQHADIDKRLRIIFHPSDFLPFPR